MRVAFLAVGLLLQTWQATAGPTKPQPRSLSEIFTRSELETATIHSNDYNYREPMPNNYLLKLVKDNKKLVDKFKDLQVKTWEHSKGLKLQEDALGIHRNEKYGEHNWKHPEHQALTETMHSKFAGPRLAREQAVSKDLYLMLYESANKLRSKLKKQRKPKGEACKSGKSGKGGGSKSGCCGRKKYTGGDRAWYAANTGPGSSDNFWFGYVLGQDSNCFPMYGFVPDGYLTAPGGARGDCCNGCDGDGCDASGCDASGCDASGCDCDCGGCDDCDFGGC